MLTTQQHGMDVQKAFVKSNDTALIRCPQCDLIKDIAVGKFRDNKHTLKTRCSCGHAFVIALDFRKTYRKPTKIEGIYNLTGPPTSGGGRMLVFNISRSGVGFSVSGHHNINVGQKATINFTLDNKKQTKLCKEVIIRSVRENNIGCEFLDPGDIGKDLGFYLQPC
ncbi:MAG: PilZ domain-containing protein [Proteobacteria bacterium]|nr:PilZ domain-containing protein [Pseudomonadota bacterium]MBU1232936.1 PilZ domain-containing protein [Pseudomonadota bacterium]MBU1419115.1 PilZ domain-containing protein [Pseudomonadota bacterium]MBU1455971.1 PilZ domain-containing protein [Pseudomonadota bacterium]